jgi:hypothetical protein
MFTMEELRRAFDDEREFNRATVVVNEGKITGALSGDVFEAVAKPSTGGKNNYAIRLRSDLTGSCTCPSFRNRDPFCKHMGAAALLWLGQSKGATAAPHDIDRELWTKIEILGEVEIRQLLFEAAGYYKHIRVRLLTGDWAMPARDVEPLPKLLNRVRRQKANRERDEEEGVE